MPKTPKKKTAGKKPTSKDLIDALADNTRALNRHSRALEMHARAFETTSLTACILDKLHLKPDDLDKTFDKLFGPAIQPPIERIHQACKTCYSLDLGQVHARVDGKHVDTLRKFIICIS